MTQGTLHPAPKKPIDALYAVVSILQGHVLASDSLLVADKLWPGGYSSDPALELAIDMLRGIMPDVDLLPVPEVALTANTADTFKKQIGDLHTASFHLRELCDCLDEIYQGGGGSRGQAGALITAVSEKATRLEADLDKLWDGVAA